MSLQKTSTKVQVFGGPKIGVKKKKKKKTINNLGHLFHPLILYTLNKQTNNGPFFLSVFQINSGLTKFPSHYTPEVKKQLVNTPENRWLEDEGSFWVSLRFQGRALSLASQLVGETTTLRRVRIIWWRCQMLHIKVARPSWRCKRFFVEDLDVTNVSEQWKKPWLVGVYRALYSYYTPQLYRHYNTPL